MTAMRSLFDEITNKPFTAQVCKFAVVVGLHVALAVWILNAQIDVSPEALPIRLDVRTIDIPLHGQRELPRQVTDAPKPKPVANQSEPLPAQPVPAAMPSMPQVQTSAEVAPPAAQPKVADPVVAAATPVAVTAARFDADYLQNPAPTYPILSRKLHEEGKVLLQVQVTAKGDAGQVEIKRSSGFSRLDNAAMHAVRQWRFVPAKRGSEAVAAGVVVPIVFRLDD